MPFPSSRQILTRPARTHALAGGFVALAVARALTAGDDAPRFAAAQAVAAADTTTVVSDLPLVEVPASADSGAGAAAPSAAGRTLAILLTGDGGWAGIDRGVAAALAARGVAVVGLDARAYLSTARTPDDAARDVARVARHYLAAWRRSELAVVGYSRGADVAPFVVARMPADLRSRLSLVALLGPAIRANFQFHWSDLLRDVARRGDVPTLPELERIRDVPVLCVYGENERESLCPRAGGPSVTRVRTRGEHHFDGNYRALGALIANALDQRAVPPTAGGGDGRAAAGGRDSSR